MSKSVAILMATFNGEEFLEAQLDSIAKQNFQNWKLFVSDDGSTDETIAVLKRYQSRWGKEKLEILQGPQAGFQANFMSLVCNPKIKADFYAFCDQDDLWLPNKLEAGLAQLEKLNQDTPLLYCGRTQYVNHQLDPMGLSPLFSFPPSFRNALVQSIAGGNTMIFNQALRKLLFSIGNIHIVSHDWWTYQIASGAGGIVIYDPIPTILYRQHANNIVGENSSKIARFERMLLLLQGRFKAWTDINLRALDKAKQLLSRENLIIMNEFKRMRDSHIIHRFRMIEVCGLYRQTWRGTISLILAAIFKKI